MSYRRLLIIPLFLLQFTAKANYNFNPRCIDAYNAIFDLRLNDARSIINAEKRQNPQNGINLLLDNYVDYFSLLTSDNKADYEKWKDHRSDRLDALESNEEDSPYYLYSQAEVYLQWGLLKAKFGDYMSSGRDLKKARNLLTDNAKKYPDFLPNQKDLALINVVFGALPASMKGMAHFLGMDGNSQAGVAQLEKLRTAVINTRYSFYSDEIVFFLCYMDIDVLHNKNNYAKLTGYLATMDDKSLMKKYLQGYVAAKTAHNDDAIEKLQDIPKSSQYIALPAVDYLLGCAKLCRMDSDASDYLLKYIAEYKGRNYIKDAYLKTAYTYLLKNDLPHYSYYVSMTKTKGYTDDEKDKQALKEANDNRPNNDLLRARLFFDGGYFAKALAQLQDNKESDFKLFRDKIEFNYRLGRIYERLNRNSDAIASYSRAIAIGRNSTYYFAANAALSTGELYEHARDYNMAAHFYHDALSMKNHEYQSSIDTQAKEGLERIHKD